MSHGTLSNEFPGWYVTFQTDVLSQLPRPGELSEDVADGWHSNRESMKKVLCEALCPTAAKPAVEPVPAQKPEAQPLLIPVGTAIVAATTTPFVARDRFVVNTKKNAPVKISYLGDNFKGWFLGKTEEPFAGSTLKYGKLSRYSVDGPILKELGGEKKAETTLIELFSLMEAQKNGESRVLLTNGYANIFYIKDSTGTLHAVHVLWSDGRWIVNANAVTNPHGWNVDDQVFSRISR